MAELLIQIVCLISIDMKDIVFPYKKAPLYLQDKVLGHRPNPLFFEHDKNGFRNIVIPKTIDIVAMGDSQTYGIGVRIDKAWPQQLQSMSKLNVYNMAFGGYGPAHYLLLIEEACKLNPKLIIVAMYSGNDLYDGFHLVYDKNILFNMKTSNNKIMNSINQLENIETLDEKSYRTGDRVSPKKQNKKDHKYHNNNSQCIELRYFFANNCGIYGFLRALKNLKYYQYNTKQLSWRTIRGEYEIKSNIYQILDDNKFNIVFMAPYRLGALDLNDIRLKEGLRIQKESILRINHILKNRNIKFLVLIIPTTEYVFFEYINMKQYSMKPVYYELIRAEQDFMGNIFNFLNKESIPSINTVHALRNCLIQGKQPYPMNPDGHPNEHGYNEIAKEVYKYIINHTDLCLSIK